MKPSKQLAFLVLLSTAALSQSRTAAAPPPENQSSSAEQLKKLDLEQLMAVRVVTQTTVSRVEEKIDQAPGSVYVYPASVIKERGYRSLGDLLQTVPGFTVFHRDLQFVAGVRGLNANDNEKITLLINGQQLNQVNEPDFLNGPINLDNVERVEVVVGPSSFFQQANTLAATVNVITKQVEGVEAVAAVGNDLRYSATLMTGHRWAEDKFVTLSFTTEAKQGFDAWNRDFRVNLANREVTGRLDWPSYFGIANARFGELSAQFVAYRSTWPELHIENGDPGNHGVYTDEFYSLQIKDEHAWTPNLTSIVRLDATYKKSFRENEGGPHPPINGVEQHLEQWNYTGEIGLRYTGFENQTIQGGVQGSYDDNLDNYFNFSSTGTGEFFPKTTLYDQDTDAIGFYLDDTIQLTKWLRLIGGGRIDKNTRLDGEKWYPGWRAAVIVQPTSNWTSKFIYNRSVRMPSSIAALNQAWGVDHLATSPQFATFSPQAHRPEILSTFELQNIFYLGKVRVGASLYHQELEDFITWEAPHTNVGNFRGNGAELNILAPLHQRFSLWANGAWNDSELHLFRLPPAAGGGVETHHAYTNSQGHIIGSAEYTANAGFDWRICDHLTFSPSVRYFTEQAALNFDPAGSQYETIRNRYYLDAALTWDHIAGKEFDLRVSGRNLLDNRDPVGSQINGDTYRPRGLELVVTAYVRF